jgi:hypothetical protein
MIQTLRRLGLWLFLSDLVVTEDFLLDIRQRADKEDGSFIHWGLKCSSRGLLLLLLPTLWGF